MVVLSAALFVARGLPGSAAGRPGSAAWNATLAAGGAYIVAVPVVMLILPTIDETPGPLRDDAGNIVFGASPPTICTSSGCSRWVRRS